MCIMRRMKRIKRKLGPKESPQVKAAAEFVQKNGDYGNLSAVAMNFDIHPSTIYRALQRRKERK